MWYGVRNKQDFFARRKLQEREIPANKCRSSSYQINNVLLSLFDWFRTISISLEVQFDYQEFEFFRWQQLLSENSFLNICYLKASQKFVGVSFEMLIQQSAALSRSQRHSHRQFLRSRMVFFSPSRFYRGFKFNEESRSFLSLLSSSFLLSKLFRLNRNTKQMRMLTTTNDSAGVEGKVAKYRTVKQERTSQKAKSNERKCDIDSDNTTTIVLVEVFGTQPPKTFFPIVIYLMSLIYTRIPSNITHNLLGFTEQ